MWVAFVRDLRVAGTPSRLSPAVVLNGMFSCAPYVDMIIINIAILILFGILLAVSARLVVRAAGDMARQLGLPTFIIGFFVLGALTSTPEFFVMLQAAADGVPTLSAGNLLGGSLLLLSFVMGLSAVILGNIKLNHGMRFADLVFAAAVVAAPVAALQDGTLSRVDGLLLVGFYLLYVIFVSDEKKLAKRAMRRANHAKHIKHLLGLLAVGVGGMLISSKIVVESAEILMAAFNIPALVFGLFILSIGTNLPELTLAFQAIERGRRDIAFGDFLGSSVANTFILGVLGVLAPFTPVAHEGLRVSLILLLGVSVFFVWAAYSKQTISRREGLGLLVFYGLFVVYQLFLAS